MFFDATQVESWFDRRIEVNDYMSVVLMPRVIVVAVIMNDYECTWRRKGEQMRTLYLVEVRRKNMSYISNMKAVSY